MNYEIVELEEFSGRKAAVYSILMEDDELTAFDHFVDENVVAHKKEIEDIISRLTTIGHATGAREQFFRIDEGKPGDGVCALYDFPDGALRLYCIRYGTATIIVGGGGPKTVRAWQLDDKLDEEATRMIQVSKDITKRIKEKEIYWSDDQSQLLGNIIFSDDEE